MKHLLLNRKNRMILAAISSLLSIAIATPEAIADTTNADLSATAEQSEPVPEKSAIKALTKYDLISKILQLGGAKLQDAV